MRKILRVVFVIVIVGVFALAQDKPAPDKPPQDQPRAERPLSFYKIEYVLRELQDGKAINSRTYMMTVENNDRGEAKVGARVPVSTGTGGGAQWQYLDAGINISCRVVSHDDYVGLRTSLEISSFVVPEQTNATGSVTQPVIRQMRTEMAAAVPIGKQTVIGVIDDANSTKRYEVAVTATRLK